MLLDHPSDEPTAIRTHIAAIFASLELSRSTWLVTSLSPGKGEKMSRHSVTAGHVAELLVHALATRTSPANRASALLGRRSTTPPPL